MAPTEYRVIAKRATLRAADRPARRRRRRRGARPRDARRLARGDRAVDPRRLRPDRDRPADRHAARRSRPARARWASRCPACGSTSTTASWSPTRRRSRRSSCATSARSRRRRRRGAPATASRATSEGFLHFVGRTDDVIISAGYRIGPFEVESALVSHAAVAEAAVVAAPDDERGSVVRAVVVLRDGYAPSDALAARAPGPRQGPDGAVQVPARRRLRRRAAQDAERQGPPRGAALSGCLESLGLA